ncbi:MAG: phosphoenolpyruvate carboxylase [Alphaproteobacteria bacterium]
MSQLSSSDNHLSLARSLSNKVLDIIRTDALLGGEPIADRLAQLRDAVWPENGKSLDVSAERSVFHHALKGLNDDQKTQLFEAYARLGHVYEIAGLAARHHFFMGAKQIPSGVKEFLAKQNGSMTLDDAIGKLNKPVFEVVMTMHPTNTHSLQSMQAQRALAKAVEGKDDAAIESSLRDMLRTPVLHQQDGKDTNFTVRDETAVVLNFLGNLYEDMTAVYAEYDDGLRGKYGDTYKPQDLKLKFQLGSWGSAGDKDGNSNVTAETTLEAIAMHTSEIVARYKTDVETIDNPALADWQEKLTAANTALQAILPEVAQLREDSNKARKGDATILGKDLNDRFDALSKKLVAIRKPLDAKAFEQDVSAVHTSSGDAKALDLLRKIRIFGFDFSKIEYRETAEEYGRVAAELIAGYTRMSAEQRKNELTKLLSSRSDDPQHLLSAEKHNIIAAANKPYSAESALPIAYHTMKRMELARDFPTMIQDNVLAECGRADDDKEHTKDEIVAQGTANILEAQLMQRMIPEKDGRTVKLGIIPLFEEPNTMMNIDAIMRSVYDNEAYQQHLETMKDRHDGKRTQQVQIAHSDNARRSGLLAARAYIHEAHKKMRALNEEYNIGTEFFEGGSISDAYRNGVRAVSASVNAFDLHDYIKFTFQGGDLVNYFNAPSSSVRLLTRNITHAASRFEKEGDKWIVRNRANETPEQESAAQENRKPNPVMEDVAIAALKDTLTEYQKEDFQKDKMGVLLAVLDCQNETRAGGRGSRAAKRGGEVAFARTESTQMAIAKRYPHLHDIKPVDIEKIRTIAFSEAWQQAGIVPSWLGSKNLGQHLLDETRKKLDEVKAKPVKSDAEKDFITAFTGVSADTIELTPKQIKTYYNKSPTFRDAEDRSAFALAMTDPNSLQWIEGRLAELKKLGADKNTVQSGNAYLAHVQETYKNAADLAYAALKGEKRSGEVRADMLKALPHLARDVSRKANYRDFLLYTKIHGTGEHDRGVLHNAGDTVVHGRLLAADDPAYGAAVRPPERDVALV